MTTAFAVNEVFVPGQRHPSVHSPGPLARAESEAVRTQLRHSSAVEQSFEDQGLRDEGQIASREQVPTITMNAFRASASSSTLRKRSGFVLSFTELQI